MLRTKFAEVRQLFTRAYANWSASGQLDCEGADFLKFQPRDPSSQSLSTLGRFVGVLFYALRCGTSDERAELLNFACKLAPHESGFDDDQDDDIDARGGSRRKRQKQLELLQAAAAARDEKLGSMSDALVRFLSNSESRGRKAQRWRPLARISAPPFFLRWLS